MSDHLAYVDATYENVTANCPACRATNVYNRVTDLGTTRAICSHSVFCSSCGEAFTIGGDLINPPHELLLYQCKGLLDRKEYMQCVLGLARSYEVFFGHFLRVQLIFRPVSTDEEMLEQFNALHVTLNEKVKTFAFESLRYLFLRMIIDGCAPTTYAQSAAIIAAIPKSTRDKKITVEDLKVISNERLRDLCIELSTSEIGRLRNRVVHQNAYRPTYEETAKAFERGYPNILGLTNELQLQHTAESYINGWDRFERHIPTWHDTEDGVLT